MCFMQNVFYTKDTLLDLRSSDFHNSNLFSEHLGTHCTGLVTLAVVSRSVM